MKRLGLALLIVVVAAVGLYTQEKPPATAAPLTALEQLRLEKLNLQAAVAQLQVNLDGCELAKGELHRELGNFRARLASLELTQEEAALKTAIEAARPGFTFDPKTRTFTKAPGK